MKRKIETCAIARFSVDKARQKDRISFLSFGYEYFVYYLKNRGTSCRKAYDKIIITVVLDIWVFTEMSEVEKDERCLLR